MDDLTFRNLKTVLTGGNGFLGSHVRAALMEKSHEISCIAVGAKFDLEVASRELEESDQVLHLAGVNRASETEIELGNIQFAEQLAEALLQVKNPPKLIVYANSSQASNGSVYGEAKKRAAEILRTVANKIGAEFKNVVLPNLFGEHGKPFYNAVTATFCHILVEGGKPDIKEDKELTLLHAQDAADLLIGNAKLAQQPLLEQTESVSGLLSRLEGLHETYQTGQIPDISTKFQRDLFNTYRSYVAEVRPSIELVNHADARGSFVELIRTHGGNGQSSFSTTVPGIERGGHYHRRKVERFVVLSGQARISVRKLFTSRAVHFEVNGSTPVAIDMPTMWAHSIINVGSELLLTHFWTDDLFDPNNPDTIAEAV